MMGRLKSKKDFHLIFREGKRVTGEIITIYYRKRDEDKTNRLGISISPKVGKAVFRNKIKRCWFWTSYRQRKYRTIRR